MTQVTRRILNRVDFGTESFWFRTISGTERIPAQRGLQKRVDSGTERTPEKSGFRYREDFDSERTSVQRGPRYKEYSVQRGLRYRENSGKKGSGTMRWSALAPHNLARRVKRVGMNLLFVF
jgi:hypothetical protein